MQQASPEPGKTASTELNGTARRCPKCGRAIPKGQNVCPACVEKRKIFVRLLGFIRPYWMIAALSLGLTVFIALANLIPAMLLAELIDGIALVKADPGADIGSLLTMVPLMLALVYAGSQGAKAARSYVNGWLGERITFDIRTRLYRYLQMLSLSFYDARRTGELIARVTKDTSNIRSFLVQGSQKLIIDVVTMVAIGVILFQKNPILAAISLLPVPALLLGTAFFAKRIHRVYHRVWRSWAKMSSVLADTIPGILVVKAFAQEDREVDKFESSSSQFLTARMRTIKLKSIFFPAIGLMMYFGGVLIYWKGGIAAVQGEISLGELTLFIAFLWKFYQPIQRLSQLTDQLEIAATASERVFEVLDSTPEVRDRKHAVEMKDMRGDITLKDVSFSYSPDNMVLQDINLEINAGEVIGLVGPSGSGKTTLTKLISRFYDPDEGVVMIDGVDVKRIKQRSLRQRIGVVLQEPFLFHGTIAQNIAYGKPKASRFEIIEAAKAANAHDFILRLPDGYDTQVGERGTRLSGGERQRISIARAILNKPSIIILDEATSSVDTVTEKMIQEALQRLIKGRTTIAIAHRLSTLSNADRLVIVDDGRITEMGTHEELIRKGGVYSKLLEMQGELAKVRAV
jgi:ATP-binding cassette subfamily B protein